MPSHRSIVVFSGGTAANHLVDVFESVRKAKDCPISYIIPISDNGGSSSELIRVFGGPGIGDVRSRLVRLIPRLPEGSPGSREREAIRGLINYRLSSTDAREAKMQWTDVVDGTSRLWKDVSSAKKELIRSFFNLVNSEITKRSRPPSNTFDFTSASLGNLFLTGARLFSGSFESAICLLGSICGVEDEGVKVIPSVNSNFSHHIAAGLEDGTVIVGQNAISHPSPDTVADEAGIIKTQNPNSQRNGGLQRRPSGFDHYYGDEDEAEQVEEEDANIPGTLMTLRTRNINFNKDAHLNEELPARISRIWYINPYGQEILPPANPRAIQAINNAQAVIYSIGSLYTSLAPSIVLPGVGEALRRNTNVGTTGLRTKILILNGCLDREVGPQPPHPGAASVFSAADFIEAIVRAGEQSRGVAWDSESPEPDTPAEHDSNNQSISNATDSTTNPLSTISKPSRPNLLSSKSESILRTTLKTLPDLTSHSILSRQHRLFPPPLPASTSNSRVTSREQSPSAPPTPVTSTTPQLPQPQAQNQTSKLSNPTTPSHTRPQTPLPNISKPNPIYTHYITHLIHLPNSPGTPHVDRELIASKYGIQTIKVYGRSTPGQEGMRYDPSALRGAIEAILGRRAERDSRNGSEKKGVEVGVEVGKSVVKQEWDVKRGRRNTFDG